MTQLILSGQPQWIVTTVTDGVRVTEQIGASCANRLRKELTATADRVSITPVNDIKRR